MFNMSTVNFHMFILFIAFVYNYKTCSNLMTNFDLFKFSRDLVLGSVMEVMSLAFLSGRLVLYVQNLL